MSWFTENPWPPIVILGLIAAGCLAVWSSQKSGKWLVGALAAAAGAVVVYLVAQSVVTEGERVAQQIHALAEAFTKKDHDRTLSFFSPQALEWRAQCETAMNWVEFPNGIDIKDVGVEVSNENSRAVSRFRANGTVSLKGTATMHAASRWEVTWQKEAGQWKIIDVQRLNPYKDEKMGPFDARQN